jgi:oxaloacetate decarboxylase gamma subunit
MLEQSGVLTLLGMSIVFGFLVILVVAITVVGRVIRALGLNKDSHNPGVPPVKAGVAAKAVPVAAITAAVNEYRKTDS